MPAVEPPPRGHLDPVDVPAHDRRRVLGPRIGEVRHDHQPPLLAALARPLRQEGFHGVAERRLVGSPRGHRRDDAPLVAQERDVAEDVLAVLRAHPHEVLAVAARFPRAPGGLPVEVPDVGHQLAPLARQEVHHVDALGRPLQQRRDRGEEVHVRVRGHPAALAPRQHPLDLHLEVRDAGRELDPPADGPDLESPGHLHEDTARGQVDGRLAVDVGRPVGAEVHEVDAVVLEPRVDWGCGDGRPAPGTRPRTRARAASPVPASRCPSPPPGAARAAWPGESRRCGRPSRPRRHLHRLPRPRKPAPSRRPRDGSRRPRATCTRAARSPPGSSGSR